MTVFLWLLVLFFFHPAAVWASTEGAGAFPLWTVGFFAALILSIAFAPLVNAEWWGRNYRYVSIGLAIPCVWTVLTRDSALLVHTMMEYVSFIILLGSLFVIAGGIVIKTSVRGSPGLNCIFLVTGAVFASLIGTTGASMVLIRPLIRANRWRSRIAHIFIFFIFLVSNIGGLLTPLGDPPLFLGYLKGVPFTWTLKLLPLWAFAVTAMVALFYVLDRYYVKKETHPSQAGEWNDVGVHKLEIRGKINFVFLLAVLASFFMPPVVREMVMVGSALLSIYLTPVVLREENAFTYHPIIEVAILFVGIFITMIPAMKILEVNGSNLGVDRPWKFFWFSGCLSSFLDNAPTYLVFLSAAKSVATMQQITSNLIAGVPEVFLRAISVGCVFMGANTYVGNGPNFMVKAICEENGVEMPSFFGYMVWSLTLLIPLFVLVTVIFFL